MIDRRSLQRGMRVRGLDGSRLGKIEYLGDGVLVLQHGLLGRRRSGVRLAEVAGVARGVVYLSRGKACLEPVDEAKLPHPLTTIVPLPPEP
jgi:hypothetical protein